MTSEGWGDSHPALDEVRDGSSTLLVVLLCRHQLPVVAVHGTSHGFYVTALARWGSFDVEGERERRAAGKQSIGWTRPTDGLLEDPDLPTLEASCDRCAPVTIDRAKLLDLAYLAKANGVTKRERTSRVAARVK